MKSFLSFLIKVLRGIFYNTPVKHWRITSYLYSKVSRLQTGKERFPIIPFEGVNLKVDAKDGVLTAGLLNNHFERFTLTIFKLLLQEAIEKSAGETIPVADIGANIGVFTVIAASFNSRCHVHAFEPNPATYSLLLDNIALNRLGNVTPSNVAVGQKKGTASLDISSHSAALHSIHGTGTRRVDVPIVTLDDYFSELGVMPKVIKIDVEGYEPQVLLGMKEILKSGPLRVILEFNPELLKLGGSEPRPFLHELMQSFRTIYSIEETEEKLQRLLPESSALERKICSVGCNLLLLRGAPPSSLERLIV